MEPKDQVIFDPDPRREILLHALREVQQMLEAPAERMQVSLFLPTHYPFFDEAVQSILMERHPEKWRGGTSCYAVDAYLWAEQYGWIGYSEFSLKSPVSIEEH